MQVIDYKTFLRKFAWKQGEHITIIGPTGSGKTNLLFNLLPKRQYTAFIATKTADDTLEKYLKRQKYKLYTRWPRFAGADKIAVWFKPRRTADMKTQAERVYSALDNAFVSGGWCVAIDELSYVSDILGVRQPIKMLYTQGRSVGVSMICCVQRPRNLPLESITQASHLFLFRQYDLYDLRRVAELNGNERETVLRIVPKLPQYSFLYINNTTIPAEVYVSKSEI